MMGTRGTVFLCRLTISWISAAENLFLGKGSSVLSSVEPVGSVQHELRSTGQQRRKFPPPGINMGNESRIKICIYISA